ncbi:MAG: DUF1015 domain-containing protein [Acidothermus cellulolyticus]|nr:DUF1015 domain-containing protein [Acidothermus cellulolyticus]
MADSQAVHRLELRPFRGIRYDAARVGDIGRVLAPPYDVIDDDQRRALEAAHPYNVVRLILPRADGDADAYTHAANLLQSWLDRGVLTIDETPSLYVYQQRRAGTVLQRGILGAVTILPLDAGVILPHERVRPGPVADRLALMRAMQGNPEPVLLLYEGGGATSDIVTAVVGTPPLQCADTPDGISHELWAIQDADQLSAISADLTTRRALIADGHHRYTTYGYLRDEMHAAGKGSGPWDAGLALLVDQAAAMPHVEAIHRIIPALAFNDAVQQAAKGFHVHPLDDGTELPEALRTLAERPGPAFLISDGETFALLSDPDANELDAARPAEHGAAWWRLDAAIAAVFLMDRLWSVADGTDEVLAEHDAEAALRFVRRNGGTALFLKAPPLADIWAVARSGDVMPRKSTLFLPKPRSGIVLRTFAADS